MHLGVIAWKQAEELRPGTCVTLDRICDFLLDGTPLFKAPTQAELEQSTGHEERYLLRIYPWLIDAPDLPELRGSDQQIAEGEAAFAAGQYSTALKCFQEALRLEPGHPDAYNNLGATLHALGREEAAAAALKNALLVDRGNSAYWVNLIEVLRGARQFEAAERILMEARHHVPHDPDILALATEPAKGSTATSIH